MILFLQILGSLGVFLYGMKVLSEGIQKSAGQRLRHVMATATGNRFTGAFTGFIVTCLLQSSSATTVIVVSFVNAGLLTLMESIGVIMGANLGTTITAWIIAAVGKFSISKIAIPIVGIGLPLFFIGRNKWKHFGEALIGFGLLFLGLSLLKDSVPDADAVQESASQFKEMIVSFSGRGYLSYVIFLVLGIALTIVVQSSSAAMAITVTLAINGWIGFEESAFIVLGENIGTTVTAWLAALGANHHAKRAARAHFLFNVIGVCWMFALFPWFSQVVEWLALHLPEGLRTSKQSSDIGFKLAIFHTFFNFTNICLLIGFVPWLAGIVSRWVKEPSATSHPGRSRLTYISESLVSTGELHLPEAEKATLELSALTRDMQQGFAAMLEDPTGDPQAAAAKMRELEAEADRRTEEITEYLVRCASAEIGQQNAVEVAQMLRITAELESITDNFHRLGKLQRRKHKKAHQVPEEASAGLRELTALLDRFITLYQKLLFHPVSRDQLKQAHTIENEIDALRKKLNRQAMKRMADGGASIEAEILQMEMNNHCEKIGNFALNVIQASYVMANGEEAPEWIAEEADKIASTLRDQGPSD
ncbi:MAG: Na/Pi cotransporter family protein [Verrucomicrobiales bacterium]|nr:Na/Pi cotransporter family protein [Verrucomicrobiales bacterium]